MVIPNDGVMVVVAAVFGGSTVALPNEKTGAAADVTGAAAGVTGAATGATFGEVVAGLPVKLEIPVMRLEPNDGAVPKLIEATDELEGEATETVVVVVGLFAPNLNSGRDGANLGGEIEAADDTITVEIADFAGTIGVSESGLFGEKAKPPLR